MIEIIKNVIMIGLIAIMFVVWLYTEAIIKIETMIRENEKKDAAKRNISNDNNNHISNN